MASPVDLKTLLRSIPIDEPVIVGREAFPVGSWTHAAADYIDQLEQVLMRQTAMLHQSYRPIKMGAKP